MFQIGGQRASNMVLLRRISAEVQTRFDVVVHGGILDVRQFVCSRSRLANHTSRYRCCDIHFRVQLMEDIPFDLCHPFIHRGSFAVLPAGKSEVFADTRQKRGGTGDFQAHLSRQHRQGSRRLSGETFDIRGKSQVNRARNKGSQKI